MAVPEADEKTPARAGVSPDLDELRARLEEELRAPPSSGSDPRAALRAQAERLWAVSAERPFRRRPGLKGVLALPVKAVLRRLMRWYVEPLAAEQRAFNDTVLKLIDDLYERRP